MAILRISVRRHERHPALAGFLSRRIGGPRKFSISALLVLCFAITVGIAVQRGPREVSGARPQPATSVHRASAPNPRSDARVSSSDDYAAWIGAAAVNLFNAALDIVHSVVKTVWDVAFSMSNRIVSYVADSLVDPATGDRLIFNGAPGAFNLAVAILAVTMVALVMLALAGPVYVSWKSWRLSRAHSGRGQNRSRARYRCDPAGRWRADG